MKSMKIGKRGKDLAFRIPVALVRQFDLKEGDMIDPRVIEQVLIASRKNSLKTTF